MVAVVVVVVVVGVKWLLASHVTPAASVAVMRIVMNVFMDVLVAVRNEEVEVLQGDLLHGNEAPLLKADGKEAAICGEQIGQ